jgi:DNA-binding response OmpR family regulator
MEPNKISSTSLLEDAPLQPPQNPAGRILVVDDDADVRRVNMEILMDAGYAVKAAADGAAAWDDLQQNGYDLLVTDNSMPRMSGMELIGRLQKARRVLPTIMVTGMPPEEAWSRRAHLAAVLIKPYPAAELLAEVRKVLRPNDPRDGAAVAPPICSASR